MVGAVVLLLSPVCVCVGGLLERQKEIEKGREGVIFCKRAGTKRGKEEREGGKGDKNELGHSIYIYQFPVRDTIIMDCKRVPPKKN